MNSDPVIDPAILAEEQAAGRANKRKTRSSAAEPRTSSRLAGRVGISPTATTRRGIGSSGGNGTGIDVGVEALAPRKGKGKEKVHAETEPARGEEENLIGSEYNFRGKRRRTSHGNSKSKSISKSPVKKRSSLPSGKGNHVNARGIGINDEMSGIDGLADAASVQRPNPPITLFPLPSPYPIGMTPFRFPCLKPGHPAPTDSLRPFKRFDPHEFDDPKSLLEDTASLASDDEDEPKGQGTGAASTQSQTPAQGQAQSTNTSDNLGLYPGGMDGGYGMGGEMDYDTQAYQSLAALLEASNDDELFAQEGQ